MSFLMNVARTLYRPVLRSNVTFIGAILGGAIVAELFFEGTTNALWAGFNRVRSSCDISKDIEVEV